MGTSHLHWAGRVTRLRVRQMALVAASIAALAVPTIVGLLRAQELAFEKHGDRATGLAAEVMRQTDTIRRQLEDAFDAMDAAGVEVCSDAGLAAMRAVAVRMDRLAGVAYIRDDAMECSAFGTYQPAIPVGPPDLRSSLLVDVRVEFQLPFAPGPKLLLATRPSGYTGLIHPGHAVALAEDDPEISLGVFGRTTGFRLVSRGSLDFALLDDAARRDEAGGVRVFGDHLVAWRQSDVWDLTAYAAIPMGRVGGDAARQAALLAPIGFVFGGAVLFAGFLAVRQNNSMQSLFRAALRRNEIQVHYQPIVDLESGRWVGAEALARWRRRTGEWVPPTVFVPIAERHGLMRPLTLRVMELALAEVRPIVARDASFFVSLNLAASDLTSPLVHAHLVRLLGRSGLNPGNVHIELTEREVVDVESIAAAVDLYRSTGFEVGLDDFGVGYSNLGYLEATHVDYLKIDRVFVVGADVSASRKQTISHIIELALDRHIGVVAEGIETEQQRRFLHERGVTFGQGWLFASAKPILDFDRSHAVGTDRYRPPATSNSAPVT